MESQEIKICIFGDSIVWGACDYEKGGWVERLKIYFLEKCDNVDVYNLGVSGNNSEDLLKRFEKEAITREAKIIIFAIGVNDSQYIKTKDNPRVSLEKFANNIAELAKRAKQVADKIIFIGPTGVDDSKTIPAPWDADKNYDKETIGKYSFSIEDFCQKEKLIFVKLIDLLDNFELEDGLHPNSMGHRKIFEKIKEVVEVVI